MNAMEVNGDRLKSRTECNENSMTEKCTTVQCGEGDVAEGEEGALVQNMVINSSDEERTVDVILDEADRNVTAREEDEPSQSGDEDDDDDQIQGAEIQETAVVEQEHAQQQPQQQHVGIFGMVKTLLMRMFIVYIISTLMRRGKPPPEIQVERAETPLSASISSEGTSTNIFPKNMLMDMYVYITESNSMAESGDGFLFWSEKELKYGDSTGGLNGDGTFTKTEQIEISEAVRVNGSLFIHVYFLKTGHLPDFTAEDDALIVQNGAYGSQCLTKIHRQKYKTDFIDKNEDSGTIIQLPGGEMVKQVAYWNPKLTIGLVTDDTPRMRGAVPPNIRFVPDQPHYYPLVYFNSYWNLDREYVPINSTTRALNLTLTYSPLSFLSWTFYPVQKMSSRFCPVVERKPTEMDNSQDFIKMAYLDNGLFLLVVVSYFPSVHALLSFLALRNELYFWRNLGSLNGISVYCALVELFHSIVAALYVVEIEADFIFKATAFAGLAIAIWKMTKIFDAKLNYQSRILGIVPQLDFVYKESYFNSPVRAYDKAACKHMSLLLGPVLAIYVGYASIFHQYQGWYTWTISMMYGFFTTFGVLLMMPQIFINFKLKSVAHLPWRSMTYKAVDAFLDSAFAFIIQAPSSYRIGFFRYDLLYYIYLFQYLMYRGALQRPSH